jgi:hypothetical protein
MTRATVGLVSLLLFAVLGVACGGSDDGGIFKKAPQQSQSTAAAPDVPKQAQPQTTPASPIQIPNLPNLPIAVPSIQIPEVKTGSTTGACALLTKQDAAAALGAPVNDGKSLDVPKQNMGVFTVEIASCSYDKTGGGGEVSLQTWKGPAGDQVKLMSTIVCQGKEKVAGLGDSACWYSPEHREIQVFKGASFVDLTVRGAPNDDAVKNLAKKIVDKVQ